jgi:hypothetical protein
MFYCVRYENSRRVDSRNCAKLGELVHMLAFARFFASARKADRDCNIEPPTSPYAIMRRACPYRGENSGPGKDIVGKRDTQTRN